MKHMSVHQRGGFTLVEMLVVITIIAILVGLIFPALGGAIKAAKKAQAKTDCNQLVVAVKNYFNEYAKYPLANAGADFNWGPGTGNDNQLLVRVLIAEDATLNRNDKMFMEPPLAKAAGRHGVFIDGATIGDFVDPWGISYYIRVDGDYDGEVTSPEDATAPLFSGVIAWSAGPDEQFTNGGGEDGVNEDNVNSWE